MYEVCSKCIVHLCTVFVYSMCGCMSEMNGLGTELTNYISLT